MNESRENMGTSKYGKDDSRYVIGYVRRCIENISM